MFENVEKDKDRPQSLPSIFAEVECIYIYLGG